MVHALRVAARVLRPQGILIDLRPSLKDRHAGLGEGADVDWVGWVRNDRDDDRAANRAVARVLREGLFRRRSRTEFDLDRLMDGLEDFRAWLDDSAALRSLPADDRLYRRLARAQKQHGTVRKITVRGPLLLQVLEKVAPSAGARHFSP